MKLHSGQLRMSQVFFSTLNFGSSNGIYNTVLHYNRLWQLWIALMGRTMLTTLTTSIQ